MRSAESVVPMPRFWLSACASSWMRAQARCTANSSRSRMSRSVTLPRPVAPGLVVVDELALLLDLFVDGADGERARDLAGGVAAHAVGDDEERELLVDEEVVLVVVAHAAHVGCGEKANFSSQAHAARAPEPSISKLGPARDILDVGSDALHRRSPMSVEEGTAARSTSVTRRALEGDVEGAARDLLGDSSRVHPRTKPPGSRWGWCTRRRRAGAKPAKPSRAPSSSTATSWRRGWPTRGPREKRQARRRGVPAPQGERLAPERSEPAERARRRLLPEGPLRQGGAVSGHGRGGSRPSDARVWYALGLAQEARRDPGAAIASYREAIEPRSEVHRRDRRPWPTCSPAMGEHEQAIAVLDDLLRIERTNEQAAINRESC